METGSFEAACDFGGKGDARGRRRKNTMNKNLKRGKLAKVNSVRYEHVDLDELVKMPEVKNCKVKRHRRYDARRDLLDELMANEIEEELFDN